MHLLADKPESELAPRVAEHRRFFDLDRVDTQVLFERLCDVRILWQLEIGTRYLLCNSLEVFSRCPPVVISGDLVDAPNTIVLMIG